MKFFLSRFLPSRTTATTTTSMKDCPRSCREAKKRQIPDQVCVRLLSSWPPSVVSHMALCILSQFVHLVCVLERFLPRARTVFFFNFAAPSSSKTTNGRTDDGRKLLWFASRMLRTYLASSNSAGPAFIHVWKKCIPFVHKFR